MASAGKIKGLRGAKLGNAYLRWAFGEAAVIGKRSNADLNRYGRKLEAHNPKQVVNAILANPPAPLSPSATARQASWPARCTSCSNTARVSIRSSLPKDCNEPCDGGVSQRFPTGQMKSPATVRPNSVWGALTSNRLDHGVLLGQPMGFAASGPA